VNTVICYPDNVLAICPPQAQQSNSSIGALKFHFLKNKN
jgi:hypothetical protein